MLKNLRSGLPVVQAVVIVFALGVATKAQTLPAPSPSPSASRPSLESEFLKNILNDQKTIWTAPFRVKRNDAKWVVPGAVGFGALITTDRISGDEIAEFERGVKASNIVSHAGSVYGIGAIAGTFYLIGRTKNNERARETGILVTEAAIDSLIVSSALKVASQRARPAALQERSEFFDGGSSFPSGHSIQAWSAATVIANEYRGNRKVQIAAYSIASAVSVARFTSGKHYISDVVVGSALGFAIGRYVYRTRHRDALDSSAEAENRPSPWPAITPRYDRRARQYGLGLSWTF